MTNGPAPTGFMLNAQSRGAVAPQAFTAVGDGTMPVDPVSTPGNPGHGPMSVILSVNLSTTTASLMFCTALADGVRLAADLWRSIA